MLGGRGKPKRVFGRNYAPSSQNRDLEGRGKKKVDDKNVGNKNENETDVENKIIPFFLKICVLWRNYCHCLKWVERKVERSNGRNKTSDSHEL